MTGYSPRAKAGSAERKYLLANALAVAAVAVGHSWDKPQARQSVGGGQAGSEALWGIRTQKVPANL